MAEQIQTITPNTTVEDILTVWPQTVSVFVSNQTACVGCSMTSFCSIRDVTRLYNLDLEKFLAALQNATVTEEAPVDSA